MTTTTPTTIRIARRLVNYVTRRGCVLCGGSTDKTKEPLAFDDPDDGSKFYVCELCAHAGADEIRERINDQAERLIRHAQFLQRALLPAEYTVDHSGCDYPATLICMDCRAEEPAHWAEWGCATRTEERHVCGQCAPKHRWHPDDDLPF